MTDAPEIDDAQEDADAEFRAQLGELAHLRDTAELNESETGQRIAALKESLATLEAEQKGYEEAKREVDRRIYALMSKHGVVTEPEAAHGNARYRVTVTPPAREIDEIDQDKLPPWYIREETVTKVDRAAVRSDIKRAVPISGVTTKDGPPKVRIKQR